MTEKARIIPLSEDSLNRFRITHPDRDIRPLLRRIHKLPHLVPTPTPSLGPPSPSAPSDPADPAPATTAAAPATASTEVWTLEDIARENDLVSLELVKWKLQIERIMASSQNLQRQRASYLSKADSTRLKTQELEKTLAEEKAALERKQRERGQMIKCDEVAKRIAARGRTKVELDEQIASLQASLEDHRASHAIYLSTAQSRIDTFAQLSTLVEQVRSTKLPIEPQAPLAELDEGEAKSDGMDVDEGTGSRMNISALPFTPNTPSNPPNSTATGLGSSLPPSRGSTPLPESTKSETRKPATVRSSTSTSTSRHPSLPTRPTRAAAASSTSRGVSRPSALRSVTTPASASGGGREEGEVGGDEEGEVKERERGSKRSAPGPGADDRRSTRRK